MGQRNALTPRRPALRRWNFRRSSRAPSACLPLIVGLAVLALTGSIWAPLTAQAVQTDPSCPDRLETFEADGVRWEADPGLGRMAELLASDPRVFAPMPGIGETRRLFDGVSIRLARDLACVDGAPGADWVAGVAWPDSRGVAVVAGEEVGAVAPVRSVLRHELAHLAVTEATGGNLPRWLNEGYAQIAAGDWGWEEAWRLRLEFLRGRVSLSDLSLGFPGDAERARVAYMLSFTGVQQLLELGGEPGLRALFAALRSGEPFDDALRSVYGITEEQFETRWKRGVSSRYGVLYVLSRAGVFWAAVTLLLIWVGRRRRRRDKARLERMRLEEAIVGPFGTVEWAAEEERSDG